MNALAAEIAAIRLSPVDVPEDYLTRIDRLIGKLQASVSVNATRARFTPEAAAGKAIRPGMPSVHSHGIPIAIKDLVGDRGRGCHGRAAAWPSRIAPHTATLMRGLMAAGMVNLGKTHTVEFAYGGWAPTSISARRGTLGTRTDIARHRRRKSLNGLASQVQTSTIHNHSLSREGLHALQPDSKHARAPAGSLMTAFAQAVPTGTFSDLLADPQ